MFQFSDPLSHALHERWRHKVADAQRRYSEDRSPENQREYVRVLRVFTDLILRNKIPED